MGKPVAVAVAPIRDEPGADRKPQIAGDPDIRHLALGDDGVLILTAPWAVRNLAQGNTLAQSPMTVLSKLLRWPGEHPGGLGVGGKFGTEMAQQAAEAILIDLPGAVLIGLDQGGVSRGLDEAERGQLAFAGLALLVDFAEAPGVASALSKT